MMVWANWRSAKVSGARSTRNSLENVLYAARSSVDRTTMREVRPWRSAFRLGVFFPISVRGPVLCRALRRLASIWMTLRGDDNGVLLAGIEHRSLVNMAGGAGMLLKMGSEC